MRLPAALRILALGTGFIVLFGCGKKEEKKPLPPPVKIAVCFDDLNRDGNKIIKKVMEGREKKDNVEITWIDAENDRQKQNKQLEDLAGKKVKAAIIQFIDPAAGAEAVRGLAEKNIRVIALESLPQDSPVDAYISSDHGLTGQLLARFIINSARKSAGLAVLPGPAGQNQNAQDQQGQAKQQGQQEQSGPSIPPEIQLGGKIPIGVVLLTGDPSDFISGEIAASIRSNLQGSSEVSIISVEQVPQGDPSQVPAVIQRILTRQGNNIQAVMATDSRLALAAVQVLKSAGINNRVLTAGAGADEKAAKALESGDHDAEIDTRPDLLGQFALDAAVSLVSGGRWEYGGQTPSGSYSVPSRITPVRLIQGDNVFLLKEQWKGIGGDKGQDKKKESGGSEGSGGSSDSGGSGDGQGSGGDNQGSGGEGGQQGDKGQGGKTTLRITTQDGKTMEVQINGEVKKIESMGGEQGGGQQGQEGQQGGQ
ncbi:MAG: hypothetical protein JL50_18340 [Peptococcaceae bacterium BICA1-7]|nr:MAG: hypothetical protein JL50_18340 [Peptococcaceae bacterium BICA1-7]HBV99107.1 sugar ABC transporter substrate-binding protein [Desulfotomaculum sp.]